jgi:hypothetical protein
VVAVGSSTLTMRAAKEENNMVCRSCWWLSCYAQVGSFWIGRRCRQADTTPVSPAAPLETLALQAFTHGNSCLAAGQFADAIAAFHQAIKIDPRHPYVASRLAEVERRQHAPSVTPLGNATV